MREQSVLNSVFFILGMKRIYTDTSQSGKDSLGSG